MSWNLKARANRISRDWNFGKFWTFADLFDRNNDNACGILPLLSIQVFNTIGMNLFSLAPFSASFNWFECWNIACFWPPMNRIPHKRGLANKRLYFVCVCVCNKDQALSLFMLSMFDLSSHFLPYAIIQPKSLTPPIQIRFNQFYAQHFDNCCTLDNYCKSSIC